MESNSDTLSQRQIDGSISLEVARSLMEKVLHPRQFCAFRGLSLHWESPRWLEEYWELFRGNVLPARQCWGTKRFFTAGVYVSQNEDLSLEPIVSIKFDEEAGQFHVVRAIACYVWEGNPNAVNVVNVVELHETTRWVRELVGTVDVPRFRWTSGVLNELRLLVAQAVYGTSRLPLTSLETPLPQFALGQLGYFFNDGDETTLWENAKPHQAWRSFLGSLQIQYLTASEHAKALELMCRTIDESDVAELADSLKSKWAEAGFSSREVLAVCRRMFNDVSLSPYTEFVDRALSLCQCLEQNGVFSLEEHIDFLSFLLRQLGRHLTAYDLETFHHRGANYPDALFIDALLREYVGLIDNHPELFAGERSQDAKVAQKHRVRRRALRQGCLIRRRYEKHLVPDVPTSPGENTRVLPAPYIRVPDEQLTQIQGRRRRLFDETPTAELVGNSVATIFQHCINDLTHLDERREMGAAIFIDRPLGVGKQPPEPDRTLLFSYEAFSYSIAKQRLAELRQFAAKLGQDCNIDKASFDMAIDGLPAHKAAVPRRGATSLADVQRVADDFVLLRTFAGGVREFFDCFDFTPLWKHLGDVQISPSEVKLIVPVHLEKGAGLGVFDANYQLRGELEIVLDRGYCVQSGIELPVGGLRIMRVWNAVGEQRAVANVNVKPRHAE